MKLAISGKGGTGKTTFAAALAVALEKRGRRVILVDADPDANLAETLGVEAALTPLSDLKALISERTGTGGESAGPVFRLNPKVDDIPEKFFHRRGRILLGVMGPVKRGEAGCYCPENAFLKALLRHLVLARDDAVILDMEAGIEHLGRGTVTGVDCLLVMCEPSRKSVETALRIAELAAGIGMKRVAAVGNLVSSKREEDFLRERLEGGLEMLGRVPYHEGVRAAGMSGRPFWEEAPAILEDAGAVLDRVERAGEP